MGYSIVPVLTERASERSESAIPDMSSPGLLKRSSGLLLGGLTGSLPGKHTEIKMQGNVKLEPAKREDRVSARGRTMCLEEGGRHFKSLLRLRN